MCSGAHWNFLIVFWCSLEFSHCVLVLIGIFSLCSGANWNCLIVFWCSLELSHCVLVLIGIVSLCSGAHWNCLIFMPSVNTHNICFIEDYPINHGFGFSMFFFFEISHMDSGKLFNLCCVLEWGTISSLLSTGIVSLSKIFYPHCV